MKYSTTRSTIVAIALAAMLGAGFASPANADDTTTTEETAGTETPATPALEGIPSAAEVLETPPPLIVDAAPAAAQALRPASGGTKRFSDVQTGYQFYKPITWMYSSGLSTGTKTSQGVAYLPKDGLSREAMAAFLYRQAGSPAFKAPSRGFNDVPKSNKFYKSIMWMRAAGLSTGHADGSYRPKDGLSREAMAAFLYRQAGKPASSGKRFADVSNSHKFAREIKWMRAAGITTGYADGSFRPKDGVSREAMAAFLYRVAGSPAFIESGTVKVAGTAAVAQTLSASVKGWQPAQTAYSYQWVRNGATIAGATGASYVLTGADQGKMIQVRVTGVLSGARNVTMTSASTAAVAAKPVTVEEIESRVLYLVNVERQKRGLNLLWQSDRGIRAREWSQHLVDTGKFEHSSLSTWYANSSQGQASVMENLTMAQPKSAGLAIADQMVTRWMNSEPHRNAMLSPYIASASAGVAFNKPWAPGECDPEFFDCGPESVGAIGTLVMLDYYPDNLRNDIYPYPIPGFPNCQQNSSLVECQIPGGRSLPGRTPPNGLWG